MAISQTLNINGKAVSFSIDDPDMPLLYALRDYLDVERASAAASVNAEPAPFTSTDIDAKAPGME